MKKRVNPKTARTRTVKKSPNRSSKTPTRNKSLKGLRQKRWDTKEKQINHLKKKNRIITFKDSWSVGGGNSRQVLVTKFIADKKANKFQLLGMYSNSLSYRTIEQLLDAIDWQWMDDNI